MDSLVSWAVISDLWKAKVLTRMLHKSSSE